MHVGSGDSNYGVIDKLVQRDPTDDLPCIFSSSLKGAFREYWEESLNKKTDAETIFGKGDNKGAVVFHQAHLLSIPIRSNKYPYFNVTAPMAIQALIDQSKLFNIAANTELDTLISLVVSGEIKVFNTNTANLLIEDFEGETIVNDNTTLLSDNIKKCFGNNIALVDDESFKQLCSDYNLPVIARNNLENGQSKNLWYEQIIPRETRFFFAVTKNPGKSEDSTKFFTEMVNEQKVQIGANATIGYGQCLINKMC